MGTTVAEIQRCKPDLCLPDGAEETLAVFSVVDQMQTLLQDLEKVGASQGSQSADRRCPAPDHNVPLVSCRKSRLCSCSCLPLQPRKKLQRSPQNLNHSGPLQWRLG